MSRPHDLEGILVEIAALGLPTVRPTTVDWVDLDVVDESYFDEEGDWACITHKDGYAHIGLHPRLKRAPKYVVRCILFHEVLHEHIASEGANDHPHAFMVAWRLCPRFQDASDWLTEHAHSN